jgi:hypothetical protein
MPTPPQMRFNIPMLHIGMDFDTTESAKTSNDDQPVDSCEELSIKLNESTIGKFMWKILAPFLQGHILYTPNDEFTKSIIEKVTKKDDF